MKALYTTKLMVLFTVFCSNISLFAQYNIESITHATNGSCNGAIIVSVDADNGPHSYEWTFNGNRLDQNNKVVFNLCAGKYVVSINDGYGCKWVLDTEILQESGCFLATAQVSSDVKDACTNKNDGAISLNIPQSENYTFNWDNGATTSAIAGLKPGEYCVVVQDPKTEDCFYHECFTINEKTSCNDQGGGVLIVNEMSNGTDGQAEYIEILVLGDGTCNPVDLRGYIIDDNNGDFSHEVHGICNTGISAGHNRFKYIERWAKVLPGSKILIYKSSKRNDAIILTDDVDDSDVDGTYVVPLTAAHFEGTNAFPSYSDPYIYPPNIVYADPSWAYMTFNDQKDAVQIRQPDGSYGHGFSYGNGEKMSGGPNDLWISSNPAGDQVIAFQDGDFRNKNNFAMTTANGTSQTPGVGNSVQNDAVIENITCSEPLVIINEFSYGETAGSGYIELLVLGNGNCDKVNLQGYIIDDNNGDFSEVIEGSGISSGHIKFPSTATWAAVPVGALILIYNPKEKSSSIPADDQQDADKNGVYILSIGDLVGHAETPSQTFPTAYKTTENYTESKWSYLDFFQYGDAVQIRYPEGNYCHGISYGSLGKVHGGLDNLLIEEAKAIGKLYAFSNGDPTDRANYEVLVINDGGATPGVANNTENEAYIATLCNQLGLAEIAIARNNRVGLNARVYPNPFTNFVSVDLKAGQRQEVQVKVIDFIGRVIFEQKEMLVKGNNHILVNLKNQLVDGIYYLTIGNDEGVLFEEKIVRVKE